MNRVAEEVPTFRLTVRLHNNRLIKAVERLGFTSTRQAAQSLGVHYSTLCALERFQHSPLKKDGTWKEWCVELAEKLFSSPEDLWPEEALKVRFSVKSLEVSGEQAFALMGHEPESAEKLLMQKGAMGEVERAMQEVLEPRERQAILEWIETDNFVEVGENVPKHNGRKSPTGKVGISHARARELVYRAIRKVRRQLQVKRLLNESSPFETEATVHSEYRP